MVGATVRAARQQFATPINRILNKRLMIRLATMKILLTALLALCVLPAFALNVSSQIDTACRHSEHRGTTAIKPSDIALDSVYQDYCRLAFGSDVYAANDTVDVQLSGWLEQSYVRDEFNEQDAELRWLWQNSYMRWSLSDRLQISLGVSNHEQGPGYAWNPSNPFFDIRLNERDSAMLFRREADPMLAINYLDDWGSWRFMAMDHAGFPLDYVERGRDRVSYMLTRKQLLSSSQLSFNVAWLETSGFASIAWEWTATDQLELHAEVSVRESRKVPFFSSQEIFPSAWLSQFEGENENEENREPYHNAMLGFQYTFSNNINFILEYFYQEDGYSESEWQVLKSEITRQNLQLNSATLQEAATGFLLSTHQWLRLLHRDYVFARVALPSFLDDGELAIFARQNLIDSSYIAGLSLEKPVGDHFTLGLSYQLSEGDEVSEAYWIPLRNEFAVQINYKF